MSRADFTKSGDHAGTTTIIKKERMMTNILKHTGLTLAAITLYLAINGLAIALTTRGSTGPESAAAFMAGQLAGTFVWYVLWYGLIRADKPRLLAVQTFHKVWLMIAMCVFVAVLAQAPSGLLAMLGIAGMINTLWLLSALAFPGKGNKRYDVSPVPALN